MRLLQRGYAATTDNSGTSVSSFSLHFAAPSKITAVSFTLVVNEEEPIGCATNPAVRLAAAGFGGDFFNCSSSPTGASGNVMAGIAITRASTDAGTALRVGATHFQCNDPSCATNTLLLAQELASVQPGSKNTLSLKWDQPNHQFVFQLNKETPVASTYTVVDSFPPSNARRSLEEVRAVPHCTTTPRPFTSIDAFFSNVYVNP